MEYRYIEEALDINTVSQEHLEYDLKWLPMATGKTRKLLKKNICKSLKLLQSSGDYLKENWPTSDYYHEYPFDGPVAF